MLHGYEDDAIVLITAWDQEAKYGYNYATIAEVVDEQESFKNLGHQVKILTKDAGVVDQFKLRGKGRRFVVIQ